MDQSRRPAVDDGYEAQDGIEHADAEEVPKRAKMRDTVFGIKHVDFDGYQVGAAPSGED